MTAEPAEPRTGDPGDRDATPAVSVVIPCYGHAAYLPVALDSVAAQGEGVETVVVDDGSPDPEATARVVERRPSVRFLARPHAGVSAARNSGLEACRGRFVLFLDADDRLLPAAIEAGLDRFARRPEAGYVHGRYRFIHEDGSPAGQPVADPPALSSYLALVRENYIGMLATVLFRTSVVREAGGFRTDLLVAEDYELLLRIARRHPIVGHDAMVAEYRRYATSASADATRMLRGVLGVLAEERRAVAEEGAPCLPGDLAPQAAELALREAFEAGERFFKLFYGTRVVRQIFHEGVLRGRLASAGRWSGDLWRGLGPRLALVSLPPAVAVAAARKSRWIARDVWRRLRGSTDGPGG